MRERFIKISNNKIYFTNSDFVGLEQTNFPENSLKFKYHLDTYLKVELSNYNEQLKSLDIEIKNYKPKEIQNFNNQELKKKINKLIFKKLEWDKLIQLLSNYQSNLPKLIPEAFKEEEEEEEEEEEDFTEIENENEEEIEYSEINSEQKIQDFDFEFTEKFNNAIFHLGYVSITKIIDIFYSPIELKIYNDKLLPEYDYIKNYFSNYYNNENFNITTKIEIKGNEIISIISHSKEIENINNEIIDSVKRERILNTIDFIDNSENEKSTFTADEILSKIDNSLNIFKETEEDIINLILELKNPRNKKQLVYLSDKKHKSIEKIRFTLKPLFGFIFFIEGKEKNHMCWELLNSHATYLWSFEKFEPIYLVIKQSEININTIKQIGRQMYRNQVKMNQLQINSIFSIIKHPKSNLKDNFDIWKSKLISKLV
jgi:hypothetical protein